VLGRRNLSYLGLYLLTAAREAFKQDVELFGRELKLTADIIDGRIAKVYSMTLVELESVLLKDQAFLVNGLRKARGLPELAAPIAETVGNGPGSSPDKLLGM
jgi:hypothetical protein